MGGEWFLLVGAALAQDELLAPAAPPPPPPVAATVTPSLTVATRHLGEDLDVHLLQGYPASPSAQRTYPLGFEFVNHGDARTVTLDLPDGSRASVDVPAGERLRWFADVRADADGSALTVHDLRSGDREPLYPTPTWTGDAQLVVAELGAVPPGVGFPDGPIQDLGPLDRHVPDTWRRLAGLDLLLVGPDARWTAAGAHPQEWAVLRDWVLAGGLVLALVPRGEPVPPGIAALTRAASAPLAAPDAWVVGAGRVAVWRFEPGRPEVLTIPALGGVLPFGAREAVSTEAGAFVEPSGAAYGSSVSTDLARAVGVQMAPPYGWIGALLTGYALVVGPIGWWVFVRRRQQPGVYLLFTIGVSSACSAGLVVADLAAMGLAARGVGAHLRVIDQAEGIEVDGGAAVVFAPSFGASRAADGWVSALVPFGPDAWNVSGLLGGCDDSCAYARDGTCDNGGACAPGTDCTDCGQYHSAPIWTRQVTSGAEAISVRTTTHLVGSTVRPSTGALLVTPGPDGPIVENRLGLALEDVALWQGGREWHVAALADGEQARAEPGPGSAPRASRILPERLQGTYGALAAGARDRYVARGRPRTGFPRLLANGFVPIVLPTGSYEDEWLVVGLL